MTELELTPDILEQFKTESKENIATAEDALLRLEKAEEATDAMNELFRSIHTIKGSADYLGLRELTKVSHAFESILDSLRKASIRSISGEQSDIFLDVLDVITLLVSSAPNAPENTTARCQALTTRLEALGVRKSDLAASEIPAPRKTSAQEKSEKIFKDTVGQQCDVLLRAQSKLQADSTIDPGVRGMVSRALQCVSNASQFIGERELEAASLELKSWVLSPASSKEPADFILRIDVYLKQLRSTLETVSERVGSPAPSLPTVLLKDQPEAIESKTVRIDQGALDGFMNLVGELIVARNAFSHIQSKFSGSEEERVAALKELRDSSNRLTHITGELQRNVMEMRMLPVKSLFQRYPRMVRDVGRKMGKSVELVFEGEDTEIDKGIADLISEPLMHIVRNAVAHGIESPQDRKKAGKSEVGTLIMKASHQGNVMVIEITDDGYGIDVEKIKEKIIEKGLLTFEQAGDAKKSELLNYIFSPGFSTASSITDISGRGVGLDVVKTNLKKIKGTVSVNTEVGQGTCFRLEVPLTMAIMRALLVKAADGVYAISLQDVNETVKFRYQELKSIRQKRAITLRGEVIMVESLTELMGIPSKQPISADARVPILILKANGKKFGLLVDSVFRQEEIVVKPVPESYSGVPGLAGASILGDGKVILILDAHQLHSLDDISGFGSVISF